MYLLSVLSTSKMVKEPLENILNAITDYWDFDDESECIKCQLPCDPSISACIFKTDDGFLFRYEIDDDDPNKKIQDLEWNPPPASVWRTVWMLFDDLYI